MSSSKKRSEVGIRSIQITEQNNSFSASANTDFVKPDPHGALLGKDFSSIPIFPNERVVQRKLSVNEPGDRYEQEADTVANKILQSSEESTHRYISKGISKVVQSKGESAGSISESLNSKISSSKGSGVSMDKETQSFMSGRFGFDFSAVKIHVDDEAVAMNKEISAKAFTVGNDIYFNRGEYKQSTQEGKKLLAHELTHVVQQHSTNAQSSI